MSNFIQIDSHEIDELFNDLSTQKVKEILFTAIKAGARALRIETWKSLTQKDIHFSPNRDHYNSDIRVSNKDVYGDSMVRLRGFSRWWETGTQERYARTYKGRELAKPRRTGKITGKHFFREARNNESAYITPIMESIQKSLNNL